MIISAAQCMDCMDGMKMFPDGFFDLLVADIPYGINVAKMAFTQAEAKPAKQKNGSRLIVRKEKYKIKEWDSSTPTQEYFDEVRRVSKHQIIFGVDYVNWRGIGNGRIKWDKCVPDGLSFSRYERAYCSLIEEEITIPVLWSGMMQAESATNPTKPQGNKKLNEKRRHPTQKPRILYQKIFQMFSKPGYKILDTHLGSGNSRIVAYKMGFDFWGFEIDLDYFHESEIEFLRQTEMPLFA